MKSVHFNIVIDESGHLITREDIARDKNFFTLGCIVYPSSNEEIIKNVIQECKNLINYKKDVLHFKDIKSHQKRVSVCNFIGNSNTEFFLFGVMSNKNTLKDYRNAIGDDYTKYYNKCLLYLFERIGIFFGNLKIKKILARSSIYIEEINVDISKTKRYLSICQENPKRKPTKNLKFFDFSEINIVRKGDIPSLEIADIMASALFACHNDVNMRGLGEPRYIYELRNKIYGIHFRDGVFGKGIYAVHNIEDLSLDKYTKLILKNLHKI